MNKNKTRYRRWPGFPFVAVKEEYKGVNHPLYVPEEYRVKRGTDKRSERAEAILKKYAEGRRNGAKRRYKIAAATKNDGSRQRVSG